MNLDTIRITLQNLTDLEEGINEDFVKGLIADKFKRESMEKTLSKLYSSEKVKIFTTNDLLTTLEDVIAIEAIINLYFASANKAIVSLTFGDDDPPKHQTTTATLTTYSTTEEFKCLFCKSKHSSRNYKRYGSIEKRCTFLAQGGYCSKCIRKNAHKKGDCPKQAAKNVMPIKKLDTMPFFVSPI